MRLSGLPRFALMGALTQLSLLGCKDDTRVPRDADSQVVDAGTGADEQSPNARILPEPLERGAPTRDARGRETEAVPEEPRPRETARPFPLRGALSDDTLRRGNGPGFEMQLRVHFPEARESVKSGEQELATWPGLRVQLLPETSDRPARMRMVLEGHATPFPPGTELRARADRIGHLVLWPNQRDYRIAPPGSLHSFFADRRVDRMPFVNIQSQEKGTGTRLGKDTTKHTIVTPVGTFAMEFVEVKELPYASQLLCGALYEIVRVKSTPETCAEGRLPVHFQVTWPNEEELVISVSSWGAVAALDFDSFRTPPDLPISKQGELPPFGDYFLPEKDRFALLPLTKTVGEPMPQAAPAPVPGGAPVPPAQSPAAPPGPPRNQIQLKNTLGRPLIVLVNKVPFYWLGSGSSLPFYLSGPEVRVAARDFLGETIFAERVLVAPAQLHFGEAEQASVAAGQPVP